MCFVAIVSLALAVSVVDSTNCVAPETTADCSCRNSETVLDTIEINCVINDVNQLNTLSNSNYSPNISKLVFTLDGIDTLPSSVISFSNLTTLDIRGHDLTSIEEDAFLHVEKSLLHLYLSNTRLRQVPMPAIHRLKNLSLLHMENNLFNALHLSLQTMSLKHFIASSNNISAITRGIFPESLGFLDLSNNKLSTMNGALREHLPALSNVRISNNSFLSLCAIFEGTPNLRRLFAERNKIVTIDDGSLAIVPELKELNLSFNNMREVDTGLSKLHQLDWLDLSHNRIDHLGRNAFQNCVALKILKLHHNELTRIYDTTFSSLTCLHSLDIGYNHLDKLDFLIPLIENDEENQDTTTGSETANCTSLKNLKMRESGVTCNVSVIHIAQQLQSKGVTVSGNPCSCDTCQ